MTDIKTVGVIGAGQMGSGIAHVVALGGYDVRLHDVSRERIDAGLALIEKNLARQVHRGIIDEAAMSAALARITAAEDVALIGATDLAIEAATENEEIKKAIFRSLQPHLGPTPCWPRTPRRSRSRGWPARPTAPSGSSACTS
jgi:3-hydroxybutyryl-CoA dehydrogenase